MDSGLLQALQDAAGADNVLTDPQACERLSADALGIFRLFRRAALLESARADVVVMARDTQQVAAVLCVANAHGVPVVPVGGATGVMGAIVPLRGGIALDMRQLNQVMEVSAEDGTVRVQPGVLLADLERELNTHGLMLGHDPWSLSIATVGGAIGTDGVGYLAARYGSMGEQVAALEVVIPTGEVVRTKPLRKPASGPNLNALFIGAEGTLGIITEATLWVFRLPERRAFSTVGFASFEEGFKATVELFHLGLRPALTDLTEEETRHPSPPCTLYMAFEGFQEEVEAQQGRALKVCAGYAGADLGPEGTRAYWEDRHAIAESWRKNVQPLPPRQRWASGSQRPFDYLHLSLPLSRVLEYRRKVQEVAGRHRVRIRETAVWTHPGLFSVLLAHPRPESKASVAEMEGAVDEALTLAQEMGGAMEYCHGVGLKLAHLAEREWGSSLEVVRRIKRALDPNDILNPGKLGM
ncbi:MAG: FAD-binding oxidoreductase [Chloroflexi bacterium]|nr:FAD-binding oxidoreductase [Chloroflexota bacterium]